jgi:hypothetical protein
VQTSTENALRQAIAFFQTAVQTIDRAWGADYSKKNPSLVVAFMRAASDAAGRDAAAREAK